MGVGLLFAWAFQETLGWTFSGLVVPGYVATILLVQPITGLAVTLEAVATWGVVLALSDRVPRWWPWMPSFGRDRFLTFLLVGVGVRILFESGGLDALGRLFGVPVDPEAHALGLVVVPLMAHAMWRSGLAGLPRLGIPILLTWAVLRYLVLPHTNLSLSSFQLTYEDLAGDFVTSPRHYVLLLVGATFGSWANVTWGADFGGIIVPGLLALCWLQPERLAATVGEAVVIAWVYRAALRLPFLANANLTGGRPLVLAYSLGYVLKFVLGWTLAGAWPGFEVRSLFGFGYLLSSLLALRIVKYGDALRTLVPALGTSLGATIVGQAACALLLLAFHEDPPATAPSPVPDAPAAALRLAAWRNTGGPPFVVADEPSFYTGGDGFGGLWVRDGGAPILVRARVGPVALGDAAVAVADLVDARFVQLCGETGPACAGHDEALAGPGAVLELVDGPEARLEMPPGTVSSVDLSRITERVGPVTLVEGDAQRLVLPEAARIRLAAQATPATPAAWQVPTAPRANVFPSDAGMLRALVGEVVRPWVRWWRLGDEDALTLATARARELDLTLRRDGERTSLEGAGWAAVLTSRGPPTLVDVPAARDERGALLFGLALARTLDAGAIVLRSSPAAPDTVADPASVVLVTLAESLGDTGSGVTVRTVPQQRFPGADLILSRGRVLETGEAPHRPPWLGRLEALGFTSGWYDGSAWRVSCADSDNPARAAVTDLAGPDAHVTVFVRSAAAERLLGVESVPAVQLGGLAHEAVPFSLLDHVVPGRHALDRAGRGARTIGCDALLGCRWVVEHDGDTALVLPLAPGTRGDGDPVASVAFGAAAASFPMGGR